ncbi:MAG: PQQ-binding-like beta-propeller repeat protein, partial [Planctomycetota bacterium]|nr:PQQ-binding-like beta-propeller repeat protein [Planctomycetota bacterium]
MWGIALLVGSAFAQDGDATIADAHRWTGPRGCASGSLQSRARPVVRDVVEAWTLDEGQVRCPPVLWDGVGYVVVGIGAEATLIAFDVRTGDVRARRGLPEFARHGALVVWDNLVIAQTRAGVAGYRLIERTLREQWTFAGVGEPAVHDNEVYCTQGSDRLVRLRPGAAEPVWAAKLVGKAMGAPAVAGKFVFIATQRPPFQVEVFRRVDGAKAGMLMLSRSAHGRSYSTVSIVRDRMYVEVPAVRSSREYRLARFKEKGGRITLVGDVIEGRFDVPPAATSKGAVCRWSGRSREREWRLVGDTKAWLLASEREQGGLFRDAVAPTVLGDVVYFGSWAMDLVTREILWRLPI